ncbi:FecR family protein [Pseudoxanthomonas sp.]|jgi:Fe2+-dicitrate sensor, membrane component|uniref:FecR family protein n=1 Tax=Pseudoxanthomonas sp. TaxID=1871049 RepID=UPI002FDFC56D
MSRPDLTLIDGGDSIDQQATRWFVRLRADDASEGDRHAWRHWMQANPAHRAAYTRVEVMWSSFGDFAAAPGIGDRIAEATRTVPVHMASPRARITPRRRWPAAIASAMALVAAGTFFTQRLAAPADVAYRTTIGERRSVQLDDGTRVDLDAGTQLRVRYDGDSRHVVLEQGRAFFQVAKDTARPFDVVTDAGGVRALGTQFEVSQVAGAADVALYEGSVELRARTGDRAPPRRLGVLVPGQQARLSAGHMQMRATMVVAGARPAWLSGRLVFSDTPLAEAVAEFNRYSDTRVVLADPSLGAQRVSGVFRGDDVDAFIGALGEVYGIPEHHTANGTHVLGKSP